MIYLVWWSRAVAGGCLTVRWQRRSGGRERWRLGECEWRWRLGEVRGADCPTAEDGLTVRQRWPVAEVVSQCEGGGRWWIVFFLDMEGEAERKHKGRQKIEMKLIECENARSVTFSKRKRTLFEKAKRAAASTGATIAIFLISSKGYMHAFGTSCVHAIINEYHARRSNDNAAIAVAQNDDHRLDLLNGDPVDKLKQILECQDVSFLLGPNFDPSNLKHVTAAYSWFDDCRTKLKAKKEKQMSANPVANEQMVSTAQFDLNVTAAASLNQVLVYANLPRGFNLNVAPSADDEEMISAASHVRRFNLNVTPGADDDKEAEEKEEMARANPTRGFNLNVAPDDDEEMIPTPSN
nr:MADS-box protein FLOWERING LOCUS C-like [Ipomoea trifida]